MPAPKKSAAKSSSAKTKSTKKVTSKPSTKPKGVSVASAVKAPKTTAVETKASNNNWIGWVVAVLFAGLLFGTYAADMYWAEQFDEETSMLVIGDTTWMPVGGAPVTVVVLNDKNCGDACNTEPILDSLRASVNPVLIVREVDVASDQGRELVETFGLVSVPQFFFGEDIEALEVEGVEGDDIRFVDNLPPGILNKEGELYHLNGAQVGFKPGKFISDPSFADLDSEPSRGAGPVRIVEFTNYQCSFCKRFHDQNKALIERLIAENKITYIVKDFPMFQANDRFAHRAANCVLRQGGQEAYWQMNTSILAAQGDWSRTAEPELYFNNLASEFGFDISACVSESAIETEIMADMTEGQRYGVTGTPTIFVGTQILPGAVSPSTLEAAVNAELN